MGKAFESIRKGLTEAIGHAKGEQSGVKVWRPAPVDVAAVAQAAAFTLLNPHVYLDTVLLGFGARWLAPWFARPRAWQLLDRLIGATMFVLAALLVRLALGGASLDGAG